MFVYQEKTALITGASSGIGEAFARALAQRGMSLVLVARSAERMNKLADELTQKHGIRAEVLVADLSDHANVDALPDAVHQRGLTVDLLINNAGFGLHGSFESLAAEREQQEIQLNIGALVALTHAFVPEMLAHASGGVINIASTLAFQPVPFMAVYGATKAFVLSFTHALAEEYRGRGIRCLALCPGPTATPFYAVSGGEAIFARMSMRTADQVAATGLRAFERGRHVVIDGPGNRRLFRMTDALPDDMSARIIGTVMRPKNG